jgi:photosystem II stability/assembly factor-like uncharacterized protein
MMQFFLRKKCWSAVFVVACVYLTWAGSTRIGIPAAQSMLPSYERLGPFGGDVRSLLVDAQNASVVYLGASAGQIFKSVDFGKSWAPIYPGLGRRDFVVDTLVQHPAAPAHIYAGAWDLRSEGGGLFETRNGGTTWSEIVLSSQSAAVRDLAVCAAHPEWMIAGALNGVFVTEDGGIHWTKVGGSDLEKAESVAIDPHDPRFLYAGTWRLSYRSEDFGKTWRRSEKGMALDSDIFSLSIDSQNPENLYAGACSGVFYSTNRARSWTHLRFMAARFSFRTQVIYTDPSHGSRLYAGTTEGLYVTEDGGEAWKRLTAKSTIINAIQIHPTDSNKIIIGTESQGILRSEDGGRSWQESNSGFVHRQISRVIPDPLNSGRILANVTSGEKGLYWFDGKESRWLPPDTGISPEVQVLSISYLPGNLGSLAGTSQGVYWRKTGSQAWSKLGGLISSRIVYDLIVDPVAMVVLAGTDRGIYRSALFPLDFRLPPNSQLSPTAWSLLRVAGTPGVFFSGTTLGILRSRDQGTTWHVISAYGLPARVTIRSLVASPENRGHLFAGTTLGLYESTDGGIGWRRMQDERLSVNVPCFIFLDGSGDRILAGDGSAGGVLLSNDGGAHWEKLESPGHDSPITHLVQDPRQPSTIYLGTRDDGMYRLRLPESTVKAGAP